MTTKFISDMGPKSALIAPRPLMYFHTNHELSIPQTKNATKSEPNWASRFNLRVKRAVV